MSMQIKQELLTFQRKFLDLKSLFFPPRNQALCYTMTKYPQNEGDDYNIFELYFNFKKPLAICIHILDMYKPPHHS